VLRVLLAGGVAVVGASPETDIDTLEMAATDLRTGTAFAPPTLVIINPATWSKIRRIKNTLGDYILGDPNAPDADQLWNTPIVQTTQIAAGTAVVMNTDLGAHLYVRQGMTIQSTPYNADDWTHNITRFRIEERIALAVPRPSAIVKVTGL
jgi:HK97 family phage major capsid protein